MLLPLMMPPVITAADVEDHDGLDNAAS